MDASYIVRLAYPEDSAAIAAIYAPYVRDTVVSFEEVPPDAAEMEKRMQKVFQRHVWLVCARGDTVAGYAYAGAHRERKAYQWVTEVSVYVHPDHRKKGVATALYEAIHRVLRAQGYVQALAGMTLPNPASKGFHESMGYEPFAVYPHSGYKFGAWHDTGWWRLMLRPLPENPVEIVPIQDLYEDDFAAAIQGGKE